MVIKATFDDLPDVLRIYETARKFMADNGNPDQWANGHPRDSMLIEDIEAGRLYVVADEEGERVGVFAMLEGIDPTYVNIYDGSWRSDAPYIAIHRIAGDGRKKGILRECRDFARGFRPHLRIDTHEANIPMQGALRKLGFEYRGIIYLPNGESRIAYDWLAE